MGIICRTTESSAAGKARASYLSNIGNWVEVLRQDHMTLLESLFPLNLVFPSGLIPHSLIPQPSTEDGPDGLTCAMKAPYL